MSSPTCESCVHFRPGQADPRNLGAPKSGDCRRFPPHVFPLPGPYGIQLCAAYPPVNERFPACGEHETKVAMALAKGYHPED